MKMFSCAHRVAAPHSLPGKSLKCLAAAGLGALLLSTTASGQGAAPAVSCESLAKLATARHNDYHGSGGWGRGV